MVVGIPVLLIGGTEQQTLALVNVLIAGGYKVTVCCYYESDKSMVSAMEKAGADVLLLELMRKDGLLSLLRKLEALFRKLKPDIVHVQYIAPGLIPILAAKFASVRTIFATVHQPGRIYGLKEKFLLRTAARLCNAFFCNSKAVEESWFGDSEIYNPEKNYQGKKHFTIYNAIDTDHMEEIVNRTDRKQLKSNLGINNRPVIGVVGRLRWEKGQDILLDAMPEVIKDVPDVILLIVGDGPDRKKLENRIKELVIESNIILTGQVDYSDVIRLYTIMDVAVVPSRFEGFGLSAVEAMAAGVPVVASPVDGLKEVVKHGINGYLVPAAESQRLARVLIEMLQDTSRSSVMGLNGYKRVRDLFSIEHFSEMIKAAYTQFHG